MSVFERESEFVGEMTHREYCDSCGSETYEPGTLLGCVECASTKCSDCDLGEKICAYCDFPDEDSADEYF